MRSILSLTISCLFAGLLIAGTGSKSMTLHDYMEEHMENAEKQFKKGNKVTLERILKNLPQLAPESDREEWEKITTQHLESGELLKSCKSCHSKFKKSYKKTYRKKILEIPEDLLSN